MKAIKKAKKRAEIGLAAYASCGAWEITLDQATTGNERWFAQVEGPALYLYFEIESPKVVDRVMEFLGIGSRPPSSEEALLLGRMGKTPLSLTRDTEYKDRYFLEIGPPASLLGTLTISDTNLSDLKQALRKLKDDVVE
jgi:hypothetical protein